MLTFIKKMFFTAMTFCIRKNIFVRLFSVHIKISLSRHNDVL